MKTLVSLLAILMLLALTPAAAEAGSRQPTSQSYTLEVSAKTRWGCSRGGGSRSVNGTLKLTLDGGAAKLDVDLKGSLTSYRRYIYRRRNPKRPMRPSFSRSPLAFRKHYAGNVKRLRSGWEITITQASGKPTVNNPRAPKLKTVKTAFTLRCEQTKLAVLPASAAKQRAAGSGPPVLQNTRALQCAVSGRLPHLLRDALQSKKLRFGEGKGIKLISSGRYSRSGSYYAR
jgi:hypothetical protein